MIMIMITITIMQHQHLSMIKLWTSVQFPHQLLRCCQPTCPADAFNMST